MGFMVVEIGNTTIFGFKESTEKYITAIKVAKDYDVNISFKFQDEITYGNWQYGFFMHWEIDKHHIKGDKHFRGIGEDSLVE